MARPLSVTDDVILQASEHLLNKHGPHGLTVSEVAREVGLSRSAITLRFISSDVLKKLSLERMALRFEETIGAFEAEYGAKGLLTIAEKLGGMLKGREPFSNFWVRYNLNISDPMTLKMEERRGHALRVLIASVMPETAIEKAAAVDAFMAHMSGSMLHWQASDHPDAAIFLRDRALSWVRLAGIPIDEEERP